MDSAYRSPKPRRVSGLTSCLGVLWHSPRVTMLIHLIILVWCLKWTFFKFGTSHISDQDLYNMRNHECPANVNAQLTAKTDDTLCADSRRFTKFIWVFVDAVAMEQVEHALFKELRDHANIYRVYNSGFKFSYALYTSFFTGKIPTNYLGNAIKSDNIFYQMKRSGMRIDYVGPHRPTVFVLGGWEETEEKYFERQEHIPQEDFLLSYIFESKEELEALEAQRDAALLGIANEEADSYYDDSRNEDGDAEEDFEAEPTLDSNANRLQRLQQRNRAHKSANFLPPPRTYKLDSILDALARENKSLMLATGVMDKIHHVYSKNHPTTKVLIEKFNADMLRLKAWIDSHPDYLLILNSDHGGQDYQGEDQVNLHGKARDGNEAFLAFYNPGIVPVAMSTTTGRKPSAEPADSELDLDLELEQPTGGANSPNNVHKKNATASASTPTTAPSDQSGFPWIDTVDVCSTIAQYLKGLSIPFENVGLVQPMTNDPKFAYRALLSNAQQIKALATEISFPVNDKLLNYAQKLVATTEAEAASSAAGARNLLSNYQKAVEKLRKFINSVKQPLQTVKKFPTSELVTLGLLLAWHVFAWLKAEHGSFAGLWRNFTKHPFASVLVAFFIFPASLLFLRWDYPQHYAQLYSLLFPGIFLLRPYVSSLVRSRTAASKRENESNVIADGYQGDKGFKERGRSAKASLAGVIAIHMAAAIAINSLQEFLNFASGLFGFREFTYAGAFVALVWELNEQNRQLPPGSTSASSAALIRKGGVYVASLLFIYVWDLFESVIAMRLAYAVALVHMVWLLGTSRNRQRDLVLPLTLLLFALSSPGQRFFLMFVFTPQLYWISSLLYALPTRCHQSADVDGSHNRITTLSMLFCVVQAIGLWLLAGGVFDVNVDPTVAKIGMYNTIDYPMFCLFLMIFHKFGFYFLLAAWLLRLVAHPSVEVFVQSPVSSTGLSGRGAALVAATSRVCLPNYVYRFLLAVSYLHLWTFHLQFYLYMDYLVVFLVANVFSVVAILYSLPFLFSITDTATAGSAGSPKQPWLKDTDATDNLIDGDMGGPTGEGGDGSGGGGGGGAGILANGTASGGVVGGGISTFPMFLGVSSGGGAPGTTTTGGAVKTFQLPLQGVNVVGALVHGSGSPTEIRDAHRGVLGFAGTSSSLDNWLLKERSAASRGVAARVQCVELLGVH